MAEILVHPNGADVADKPFLFPDGSSIQISHGDTGFLTVAQAIYMLDEVKFRIHTAMKGES